MKKSLIALAVAGTFAAPAFAASGNVDVYGKLRVAIEDTNVSNMDMEVVDRVSRLGFKGNEDLGGGLKAIWQIESALSASPGVVGNGGVGGASLATRNSFIGLAGGFGTFLVGRHDTPYKLGTASLDIFGDTMADYNGINGVDPVNATHDYRSPQAIAYISPEWSGFHFAVAGIATNVAPIDNGDTIDALSATGVYKNGPLFLSLSYQDVQSLDSTAWKVGAGYTFGDAQVGLIYENIDNAGPNDRDSWLLNGKYNMGPIALKAEYGRVNNDTAPDADAWAVGADYNLSKRTQAYILYASGDMGGSSKNVNGWAIGLNHDF